MTASQTPPGGPSAPTSAPGGINLDTSSACLEGDTSRRGGTTDAGGMESRGSSTGAAALPLGEEGGETAAPRTAAAGASRGDSARPVAGLLAMSMFAGVGGIDLALERQGIPVAVQVEWDAACQRVLRERFPDAALFSDVREVTAEDVRHAVRGRRIRVLTGGFPCQDLSPAGRRAGLAEGTRSGLYREIVRIANELDPDWLVIENVPGLLSIDHGEGLATVLGDLTGFRPAVPDGGWRKAGVCFGEHRAAAWRVLDAQYFGVPQRRKRVVIVCHSRDRAAPAAVLLEPEGGGGHPAPGSGTSPGTADGAARPAVPARRARADGRGTGDAAPVVVNALTRNGFSGGADDNTAQAGHLVVASSTGRGWWDERDTVSTLSARDWKSPNALAVHVTQDPISGDVSPAIGTGSKDGCATVGVLQDDERVRRLTPLENERLQGFPDNWTLVDGTSDKSRYKQTGNAVAVPVFEWVARRLAAYEGGWRPDGQPAA